MTKEEIIEQIHNSLNEYKGINEAIDDAAFYIDAEFYKLKQTMYTEEQVRKAITHGLGYGAMFPDREVWDEDINYIIQYLNNPNNE
jgi:hypothetical protein